VIRVTFQVLQFVLVESVLEGVVRKV
jgi:hypothetical protein